MRICDLNSPSGQLLRAATRLKERWLETKEHWRDQNSEAFQEEFLQPLAPQITLTMAAIQRLAEVFEAAERDLEDGQTGDFL